MSTSNKLREQLEEVQKLENEAGKYTLLKEEYDSFKIKVKNAITELNKILESTDMFSINTTRAKGLKLKPFIEKIYEKMTINDTFQVTAKIIENEATINNLILNEKQINYVLKVLTEMKGIHKTKDGIYIRLFYQKPTDNTNKIKFEKTSFMG